MLRNSPSDGPFSEQDKVAGQSGRCKEDWGNLQGIVRGSWRTPALSSRKRMRLLRRLGRDRYGSPAIIVCWRRTWCPAWATMRESADRNLSPDRGEHGKAWVTVNHSHLTGLRALRLRRGRCLSRGFIKSHHNPTRGNSLTTILGGDDLRACA